MRSHGAMNLIVHSSHVNQQGIVNEISDHGFSENQLSDSGGSEYHISRPGFQIQESCMMKRFRPNNFDRYYNVGLIGLDPGASCFFHTQNNCNEEVAGISSPGIGMFRIMQMIWVMAFRTSCVRKLVTWLLEAWCVGFLR